MTDPRRTIQEELQQTRPFRSRREELFLAILRTAAVVRRPVTKVVEEHGISLAQYNVLRILRGAGEGGLPTLAIRERMIEEAAGITRLIDKLEGAGYVSRERGASSDRRQVYCCITALGQSLLAGMDAAVAVATESVLEPLDDAQLTTLLGLLDEVRAGAHQLASAADEDERHAPGTRTR